MGAVWIYDPESIVKLNLVSVGLEEPPSPFRARHTIPRFVTCQALLSRQSPVPSPQQTFPYRYDGTLPGHRVGAGDWGLATDD